MFETAVSAHAHPHFVLAAFDTALNVVADQMAAYFSNSGLLFSHMSLAQGGFLDLDTHWGTDSIKHLEHRLGGSADVDGLTSAQRNQLKIFWEAVKGQFVHPEGSHIHLRYWRAN